VILLDADVLGRNRTGEETYLRNLLRELPRVAPDLRFADAVNAGVAEPLASRSFARIARTLVSASPVGAALFGRTSATVPSSLMYTVRGST